MTHEQMVLFICCTIILCIIAIVLVFVWDYKKNGAKYAAARDKMREIEEEQLNSDPEVVTMHVQVVDMICGVDSVGIKQPKVVKYFVVKFKNDDGEVFDIHIPQEYYDGFDVGLSGVLYLVDGKLNSFLPDDE